MKRISNYKKVNIKMDLQKGTLSPAEIAFKNKVSVSTVKKQEEQLKIEHRWSSSRSIEGFHKKSPYYEDFVAPYGLIITAEEQWGSSPFYNPKELKGWEKMQLKISTVQEKRTKVD